MAKFCRQESKSLPTSAYKIPFSLAAGAYTAYIFKNEKC